MGLETIIVGIIVVAGIALSAYNMAHMGNQDDLDNKLALHEMTRAEEGQVIPIVYGRSRAFGIIDWYGNVRVKKAKSKGGKGGGGGPGGQYIELDAHIIVGQPTAGKLVLHGIYKDKEEYTPDATLTYNDGTVGTYVKYATYVNSYPGVAHVFLKNWKLEENATTIPSISFDVSHEVDLGGGFWAPLDNPASVVKDILAQADESVDATSFSDMESYFNTVGFTCNTVINSQRPLYEILDDFCKTYDIYLYKSSDNWFIGSWSDITATSTTVKFEDIKDFNFMRSSYKECINDITGTYRDQYYTRRTARLMNSAVNELSGQKTNKSVSLDMLNTQKQCTYRLAQMLKRDSYPFAKVAFKTSLLYHDLHVGSPVTLPNVLSTRDLKCQITKITQNYTDNTIDIEAIETLDEVDLVAPTLYPQTLYVGEDHNVYDLDVKIIELDYYTYHRFDKSRATLLFLVQQYTGNEVKYAIWGANSSGGTYVQLQELRGFSYKSRLMVEYSADTHDIDDSVGIICNHDDGLYPLDSLSREGLFRTNRVVIINNEIMKFQKAETCGANLKLLGVMRENKQTHAINSDVWITEISEDNILDIQRINKKYFKIAQWSLWGLQIDLSSATEHSITLTTDLYPISDLICVRSGSTITCTVFPNTQQNSGCGAGNPDLVICPEVLGTLSYSSGGTRTDFTGITFTVTSMAAVTITVYHTHLGYEVSKSVSVGTTDGTYR